ncbi:MAG TPA: hypothetical protein DHV16_09565 [Nitrospiraceae bacterium]|nr:MAG: hypothetical protein A2Z82_07105 [Nitrospirae bacterium GWA2_46_11]OGW23762.1 MAG: hypothetical protein A2X55_10605 [Nitrospirae bacterium GWB2_47_37]HAK89360.1 hypothetical protein [Nitrospiraceae bacterium]HCZ12477.1 hypothetical protein [Nitrospiraceae bacterium]
MDIIKIKGALYTQKKSSKDAVFPFLNKRIILQDEMPVFQFIDNSGVDGNSIHKIKVAKEIVFGFDTFLKHKSTGRILFKPRKLSELVNYIDEPELPNYRFVLDTEDKEILSEIIQQMLYLDIEIEVMLGDEESERRKMEVFSENYGDLKAALDKAQSRISCIHGGEIREEKDTILNVVSDIGGMLTDMENKNLKVAMMALKKSGKSVLVNCLLGDEYAPASTELPTFNSCIYAKSRDKKISVNYQGRNISFNKPSDVKEYILDEFRTAQMDKKDGYVLDDMEINYVAGEDSLCDYTIIDTPGPDLAGTDHKKVAYKWIGDADVVVFIVDYTKHLTKSEEEFFRDIKAAFEEHNKIYSFIVVVNKLDLMYLSEEKKSAVRFIDFLRSKLKELGYKGFIVLGVSALQYFYAQKAFRIKDCSGLDTDDGAQLRECLNSSLRKYQGMEEMTILSFVDNQIRNMMWFHGKEWATFGTLREKSGVEQLIKYINYIAVEKASIELFNHKMSLIDRRLMDIKEGYIANRIEKLKRKRDELREKMDAAAGLYEEAMLALSGKAVFDGNIDGMGRDLTLAHKSLQLIINMHTDNVMRSLIKALMSLSAEELIALQNGSRLEATDKISSEIKKGAVEKNYIHMMGKYQKSINNDLSRKEKELREQSRSMLDKAMQYKEYMKTQDVPDIDIAMPKLLQSFIRFDFQGKVLKLEGLFDPAFFKGRLARRRGLWGFLQLTLSLGRINRRTGNLKFDAIQMKKAVFLIRKSLEDVTHTWMSGQSADLLSHINQHLDGLKNEISKEVDRVAGIYKSIFDGIIQELNRSRAEIESRIEFLEDAERGMEGFCGLWEEFKTEQTVK